MTKHEQVARLLNPAFQAEVNDILAEIQHIPKARALLAQLYTDGKTCAQELNPSGPVELDTAVNFNQYIVDTVTRVETNNYTDVSRRLGEEPRILHAIMGIVTEAGELLDAYKKYSVYGGKLDIVNVKEELGDLMWYAGLLCMATGISLEESLAANTKKLQVRFPDGYSNQQAQNRDLVTERTQLEQPIERKTPQLDDGPIKAIVTCTKILVADSHINNVPLLEFIFSGLAKPIAVYQVDERAERIDFIPDGDIPLKTIIADDFAASLQITYAHLASLDSNEVAKLCIGQKFEVYLVPTKTDDGDVLRILSYKRIT